METRHDERSEISFAEAILESRRRLIEETSPVPVEKSAEEGGCGVVGFAASVRVRGRHIFEPSKQMNNRGNGKGGGIACACLNPQQLGVDEDTLRNDYILQIALLDTTAEAEVEEEFITPNFTVHHKARVEPVADWRELGLPVQPPDVVRYFVRAEEAALQWFAAGNRLTGMPERGIEDEFVYQNSVRLNRRFYSSLGDKRAFVLSHARNLMIFKIVGYAEQVVQYYGLEDLEAQVWIAHQRYPTKGRVWHPAGSHPFIGMNEALVHNGDFANYHGVTEYLQQNGTEPQFLTDTEVAALQFDLWSRVFEYPLEYVIEALAPTTELDFDRLPEEKQRVYRLIQSMHTHGSPDGPWFFIIAQSQPDDDTYRLLGITDTAMLRPQVFAFQEGEATIGLIGSEKQAIDATLRSLSEEDPRFRPVADRYWNARGGSHTDGGAFSFTVVKNNGASSVLCSDKFGKLITAPPGEYRINATGTQSPDVQIELDVAGGSAEKAFQDIASAVPTWGFDHLQRALGEIEKTVAAGSDAAERAIELLTLLNNRRYDCGGMRRSVVLQLVRGSLERIFDRMPPIAARGSSRFARIDWETRDDLRAPESGEEILVVCARGFQPEGEDCDSRLAVKAYELGWKRFIVYGLKGQRFHGCGFGPRTQGVRFDLYDSSGDYVASGMDGMEIRIHDNGQDQLGQVMKSGRLVVYGDVGQAFMYGAKGGDVYIMGNAAGRPLINAVGKPRVVINGTCLDFLAESFMAGDPHNGGGFVVLNGVEFDDNGRVREQVAPYPGSNLFSLASGGAIFVRDPHRSLVAEQLNGGQFTEFSDEDWNLILPYLRKNEELFGISIECDLLTVDGELRAPRDAYRTVRAVKLAVLAKQGVPE